MKNQQLSTGPSHIKSKMPILFLGHGNPMNAIQRNRFTDMWAELGVLLPKPRAILCISSHWETNEVYVTAMEKPKTIHDFGDFFDELLKVKYPAPGNPELAQAIINRLKIFKIRPEKSEWGLDHGSWCILAHMYPKADIPVVQLSLNKRFSLQQHYQFAKNLSWLRDQGVLIMGSGNIVHHLGYLDWENVDSGYPWADRMKAKSNQFILNNQHDKLINYSQLGEDFIKSINSQEHLIPLLYILGLQENGEKVTLFNDELTMGSLSMTSLLISDKENEIHEKLAAITKKLSKLK